jgi:glycosyltransferase involved in cell wall biosynthesis
VLKRACLETAGHRNKLDALAPTRLTRGYDRVPGLFGSEDEFSKMDMESISAFQFDRIYFSSKALKSFTLATGFRVNHAEVIVPGVSTELYFGEVKSSEHKLKKLLWVGKLDSASGVMTALEALRKLKEKRIMLHLGIYGRGESEYVSQLRTFVALHQLPVEFLTLSNQNRDLAGIYRNHDTLLYTTEWDDPVALIPLEAMACGLPVIGTATGGAGDVFNHGDNALVFTPGDPGDLASRIEEFQRNPELRCKLAEAGQMHVFSKCNESQTLDRIESYLDESIRMWQASR